MGGKVGNIVKAAVVGAAIATGVGVVFAPGLIAAAGGTLAYFGTTFAIQAVLGAVGSALQKKPEQFTSAGELQGRQVMSKQPIVSRKVVYGEVKTSGPIVFLETTNNNQDLHVAVAFTGHEINSVEAVFLNDQLVKTSLSDATEVAADSGTTPNYSAEAKITAHFGANNQVADANLVARTSFTLDHRLRGISYVYAFLTYDQDVFANGLPNISAVIKGKKVYDPRTETTGYSNNAALCVRDYLSNSTYGLGATIDEIDDASFIAAANICDEDVTVLGGGTEKRYTMNGVVDTSKAPAEILNDMLTSCGGTIYYSNGKWHIKVGAYVTPTVTLDEDDLRGPIKIQTRNSGQDQFNAVKGIFVSPENNWQPTDYPELTSAVFESEDGGDRKYIDLTLPFTTSVSTAQRLARQVLYRNREQLTLTMPCKLTAFQFEVGDTLLINNARLGFSAKPFEVVSWSFSPEPQGDDGVTLGVDMILKETNSDIYAWDSAVDEQSFTFNNTTLPNAFDVRAPGVSVSDELRTRNQEAISVLVVDIQSADTFVTGFEVQARRVGDPQYTNLGQATGNLFELVNVEDGVTYDVRARAVNSFGVRSAFTNVTYQVVGKTAPPSDVTGFTVNVVSGALVLSWTPVPDLDLSHYRVRYASATSGVTYQDAINLVERIPRPGNSAIVPARTGTYFIKAIDKLGLASINPATAVVVTNVSGVEALNVVETVTENPSFAGSFDDVVLREDNKLILDTAINFDDKPGNFDDAGGLFDGGGGNIDVEGFYYFANSVDLGAKYSSRLTATMKVTRIDYVNTFDDATGLFDARDGTFDGDVNAFDNTDAELQVRFTDDDPSGAPDWSSWRVFVVGDYSARAFEFRVRMTTTDTQASPVVEEVSVTVDMPDRVVSETDVDSGAGAKAITFSPAFKVTPAIGISASNLATGDFYEITSKSASGFTITFKNSGGSAVDRTFDYVAKGYGRLES